MVNGAVHAARPGVSEVIHTYSRAGTAVSAVADDLLPVTQQRCAFGAASATTTTKVRSQLWRAATTGGQLAGHNALVLRSHRLLTCGPPVAEAVNLLYQPEIASRAQVDVMAAGTQIVHSQLEIIDRTARVFGLGSIRTCGWMNCRSCCGAWRLSDSYLYYAQQRKTRR